MSRLVWILAISTLLASLPPVPGYAQETGVIQGSVTDQQGIPVPFAQVVVEGTDLGAVGDEEGDYVIRGVPAGSQTVTASILGYRSETATVSVPRGGEVDQTFTLAQDFLNMETIVATAQRQPRIALETSTAITTLSPRDIEREAPRSTADLLKVVPGFYVESSGGEVNNNLFARGMPADGSFRYVGLLEDGMPIYDSTELSFLNADNLVRVDKNIRQIEAVRGGSAALFSSNAPGGLVNFISKTGGPQQSGVLSFEGGEASLARIDGNVNGPLGELWRYSIGGFYRYDEGIRDPGFTGSEGGQIKANVSRVFDRGFVRVYGKFLNDENVFYLPAPLQNPPDPEFVPGFPEDGTMTSEEGIDKSVPLPGGSEFVLDLSDGLSQRGGHVQADFGFDFGEGWTIENNFRWMDYDHNWNAMLPFEIVEADQWAQGFVDDTPGAASFDITFTETGGAFDTPNGLLSLGGQWWVSIPISNVSDQLTLSKEFGRHDITVGTYLGHYEADPTWRFNDIVTNIQNAPRFVDLVIRDSGGNVLRRVTNEGFRQYLSLFVNAEQSVNLVAFFAGDEIAISDRFDVDLGVRFEHDAFEIRNEDISSFDLAGGTDAHTGLNFGTGTFTEFEEDFNEWAFSVGGNYRLSDRVSVYGRGTSGFKMPIADNVRSAGPAGLADLVAEDIAQIEGGVKVGSPKLGLSAVAYWLQIQNFPSQDVRIDPDTGETIFETAFAGEARTIGTEVEIVAAPVPQFRLDGTLTLQNPEYTDFVEEGDELDGNRIRRIPEVLFSAGAEYDIRELTLRGDWSFIGERFSNNANTVELASYNLLDLGAFYRFPLYGVSLSLNVKNVTDEGAEALTEGNPRVDEDLGAQRTQFLARPVLPRRVTGGITYEF